jgi:DNA-binding transcriptional ArsR family regulator
VPSDKLTRREVDFVLKRAAEIDTQSPSRSERASDDALSVGELVRLGEEAGLRDEAVQQALTELRRGAVVEAEEEGGALTRTLGASRVIVSRVVSAPIEVVRRAVDRFLRDQLMTIRRHHGDRIEWERAQGIWPGLVRSLDFSKRYAFSLVSRVETILSQEGGDGGDTAVTFNIDLSEMRRERMAQMGLRAVAAFALLGLGGAAMVPGFGVYDIVALAGGSVAAGGIFALERRRYLESRSRVALAPERFLDLLTVRHGRKSIQE